MSRGVVYGVVASLLLFKLQLPVWAVALLLLALYAAMGGWKFLSVVARTCRRDVTGLYRYLQVLFRVRYLGKMNRTVPRIFARLVKQNPDKVAIIFEDKKWTYKQLDEWSNRVAHVFQDAGFQPGDTVALLLDNRPEYVGIWLGLAKAGLVTALINYNLRDDPLRHCIEIAGSKAVVYGADFQKAVGDISGKLGDGVRLFGFDFAANPVPEGSLDLDAALADAGTAPLAGPPIGDFNDKLLYIYTSGTTGLPKAAVIRHSRFVFFVSGAYFMNRMVRADVIYDPLPLYHSAGGMVGVGQVLLFGCTAVLRKKFSASAFWTESIQHQCTVAQYIGETCRYLLAAAPKPEERSHKIRLMYGNGLRPQIWQEFVDRFNIKHISEFYGATEGNANIINFDGRVGAVGFLSLIVPSVYPCALIKVDEESGEPIRGPDGYCIRCEPGEPGMFVGMIVHNHPIRDFHGYADKNATKKKVARDVFRKGDAAFLSGDILVMDDLGYLFFKDRTGDTFRWRGENVSTAEVEAVISNVAGLKDCTVYGVEIPGSEGRAGMAAILDPERDLDLAELARGTAKVLPPYARPVFIRLVNTIELTGTYKLKKLDYQKQGFDINQTSDEIFFLDPKSQLYVPFTAELHDQLTTGKMRI